MSINTQQLSYSHSLVYTVLYSSLAQDIQFYSIPQQTLNLYKLLGDTSKKINQTIKKLEISNLITYKEYKEYLSSIKKDSSLLFYLKQLPDSTIAPKQIYKKYINSTRYDNYPVVGISWDNAMNFCKWKTIKDNKDSVTFIYRLPNCSEWLAANYFIEQKHLKNDFNKNYSDWTINTFDESFYNFDIKENLFPYDYIYFLRSSKEAKVLNRKRIIGNSFLHKHKYIYMCFYHYAYEGVRDIAFRIVKDEVKTSTKVYIGGGSFAECILKNWKLLKK